MIDREKMLLEQITNLEEDKRDLQQENKQLKEQVVIMEKYLELIHDLGYDYDGLNQVDSLKTLIDELIKYASLGRVCNLTEPVYENNDIKYNILHQELEKGKSE